jgi:hypothetical protein
LADWISGEDVPSALGRRKVGRPRKWSSEAERKRAYREQLAADLEDPLSLRRDLRTERRRTAGLSQENDRLRARLAAAERRAEMAEEYTRGARDRTAWSKAAADRDRRRLRETEEALVELEAEIAELRAGGHATGRPRDGVAGEPHHVERREAPGQRGR